jgi:hypothetical protein
MQEQSVESPCYLGMVVRAGERGRHARGHAARAGAGPAERPDVLLLPIHLRSLGNSGRQQRAALCAGTGDRTGVV